MKASIIIPTYRRPRFLRRALDSAATQDYSSSDYEVIVVNDGGPGTNRAMVRSIWKGDSALRYARIEHAGQSAANNRGLQLARGEYVTFLHDDDFYYPNRIASLSAFLDSTPEADIAYSLPQYVDPAGRPIKTPSSIAAFAKRFPRFRWEDIEKGHKMWIHGPSCMYRADVLRKAGGWDENLPTAEEWELHLRLLKLGHDFFAVREVTSAYRVHPGNKSLEYRKNRAKQRPYITAKLAKIER